MLIVISILIFLLVISILIVANILASVHDEISTMNKRFVYYAERFYTKDKPTLVE